MQAWDETVLFAASARIQASLHATDLRNEAMTSQAQAEPPGAEQTCPQRSLLPPAGTSQLWMRVPG